MSDNSAIEWCDASWNPIRARCWEIQDDGSGKERIGWHCEHVSEGCRNCYAEGFNRRLGTGFDYKPGNLRGKPGYYGGGIDRPEIFLDEKMLLAPLKWKKPRRIFLGSMTDLFADFVNDDMLDRIFAVMALCPQHTFRALTKRAERMRDYCLTLGRHNSVDRVSHAMRELSESGVIPGHCAGWYAAGAGGWHFKNIWLGVSCERQQEADERIPLLLQTPAAVRFISAEPLLGPIDLGSIIVPSPLSEFPNGEPALANLDWVIVGGESGRGARPMHPDWGRALRDQCQAAGVAFFFKQWGEWGAAETLGQILNTPAFGRSHRWDDGQAFSMRIGKKAAGRLLDGQEHNAYPKVKA